MIERGREVCAIQRIKSLDSKLRVETVRNTLDVVIFDQRYIKGDQTGPDQRIAVQIAQQRRGIREGEALELEVLEGASRIHRAGAGAATQPVGNVLGLRAAHAPRMSSEHDDDR